MPNTKIHKPVKLTLEAIALLNREVLTPQARKRLLARLYPLPKRATARAVAGALADIIVPVAETKVLENFPMPTFDENGNRTGDEITTVTVLSWLSRQFDKRIHWQFREDGATGPDSWLNPPAEFTNASVGMSALVLKEGEYEYLPFPQ